MTDRCDTSSVACASLHVRLTGMHLEIHSLVYLSKVSYAATHTACAAKIPEIFKSSIRSLRIWIHLSPGQRLCSRGLGTLPSKRKTLAAAAACKFSTIMYYARNRLNTAIHELHMLGQTQATTQPSPLRGINARSARRGAGVPRSLQLSAENRLQQ